MKNINTDNFDQMEEHNLYLDGKAKLITMPQLQIEFYKNLLKEVDDLLEEHGLEVILLNEQEESSDLGISFRIEKREEDE